METSPTILVVDDNDVVRNQIERVLVEAGFIVLLAEDAESGIEICKSRQIDVVLLDIVLPRMTGLAAYDEIKKVKSSIKVILTSFAGPPENFVKNNPDATFVEKSHDLSHLPDQIRKILNHPGLMSLTSAVALYSEYHQYH